ncbi:universal stress protein [Paraclostridium tenue]|uniref:Universal stress protein n=1 Tax=Paeniclostridium hominis TaxID=2764329 RepID=A0ABR7K1S8_9FIRM|nr:MULTISPECIES: universal stress protein [Paeniclostridium]MBC6003056.1 universal stress protein [Paeniclostridium hominis]MBC8630104.1 universal stress protein [[Eubacterium] tenue]MDU1538224.1 universal stress protein [Paeniclostridium sordellii]
MQKILIPIDGSDRSQKSLDFVLSKFSKDMANITLMSVNDVSLTNLTNPMIIDIKIRESQEKIDYMLKSLKNKLSGYEVTTYSVFGDAGQEIIKKSIEDNFDLIVMTKSTKKNFIDSIGSVTLYVVKKSKCTVVIVPE